MTKPGFPILLILCLLSVFPGAAGAGPVIKTTQKTVVLDPGHGGTDHGIVTSWGAREKETTLKLAQKIAHHLEGQYNVLLTRSSDTLVSAQQRAAFANRNRADLLISLHTHGAKANQGFIIFFEGPTDSPGGRESWHAQPLLRQAKSRKAATELAKTCQEELGLEFLAIPGPAHVLNGTLMPAVVMELIPFSTLRGPHEREKGMDQAAAAISAGIGRYLRTLPPAGATKPVLKKILRQKTKNDI